MTNAASPPPPSPLPYATPGAMPIAPPASGEQVQRDLAAATLAAKKIRRAAKYAVFDAWTVGIFGGLSFICGLMDGVSGVVLGMAMVCISYVEFKASARLRRLDPSATKTLGYNQLAFAALLILYALWSLRSIPTMSSVTSQLGQDPNLMDATKEFTEQGDTWLRIGWYALYGSVIAVAVFGMGGTALYYFSREKHVRAYIQTTAPWIVEMQRSGGPL